MHVIWLLAIWWTTSFSFAAKPVPSCDSAINQQEIFLELHVQNLLSFDLDGYICQDTLYLPVEELFNHLNITQDYREDRLELHYPDSDNPTRFDFSRMRVRTPSGTFNIAEQDFLFPDHGEGVHLKKEFAEEIFNMQIHFDYSSLRVSLFSNHELPVINNYRRQEQYANFQQDQQELHPEIEYSPGRYLLNGWTLDWNLSSSHSLNRQNYSFGGAAGGQFLGGDLFLSSRGSTSAGISPDNFRGQWQYPIYSTPVIRRITAGDQIQENKFSQGTRRFRGVEITNSPNAPRQHFHNFEISDNLKEGWDVEFYRNRRMVGLARGYDTDSFSFSEPVRYGSNRFMLRYYNPDGFSHEEHYFMTIPRTLLPPGAFEYSASAGSYHFDTKTFGRANFDFGLSSFMTVGGGYHINMDQSNVTEQAPYLTTSLKIANRLMVEGNHTFGYMSEGALQYYFTPGRSLSATFRKYHEDSEYNRGGKDFEGTLNTSFPINIGSFRLSTFLNARGTQYPQYRDLNFFGGFTAGLPFGLLMQLRSTTTFRDFGADNFDLIRSDITLSLSKRVLQRILLRPRLDYQHSSGRISGYQLEASSRISRNGDLSVSYHRDEIMNNSQIRFSFRYNLPFGRYNSRARVQESGNYSLSQSASGSVTFDSNSGHMFTDNRSQTRKASIRLNPYLLAENSEDNVELTGQEVPEMDVDIYLNGRKQPAHLDGNMIKNLIPYEEYVVQVSASNLDNPLWQLDSETFKIQVIPNVINQLPVPIIAVGEVSGRIEVSEDDTNVNLRGLSVELQQVDGSFSKKLTTYTNGRFYYVGLKPGEYKAILNPDEISARSLEVQQDSVSFEIQATHNGDIVDGLSLQVSKESEQKPSEIYMVQVGAFQQSENAAEFARYLEGRVSFEVHINYDPESHLYKNRLGYFTSRESAQEAIRYLQQNLAPDFRDAFIIKIEL